ncbi:hypothetical protein SASPL_147271 [Salvia splendens]|uniref:Uncharacterized protein n=1 Tax=Salvia splendens TaxID=180675 RepID=A0A8X8Z600_SALSN|nr:hypothetical protein SASPL_147271 [Salvia splendens]
MSRLPNIYTREPPLVQSERARWQRQFRELRPLDPGLPYRMSDPEGRSPNESRRGRHSNGESASDSIGYDEDYDVGYSREPYHQLHSMMPQRPPYFTRDSYVQTQSSNLYNHRRTTHSNGHPWHKDCPLLPRSTSCCHPTTQLRQAVARLEQPDDEQQHLFQRPSSCQHPLSGTIVEDKDCCGEEKRVDEELCYETELILIHHSSSLDQELDAHHKMEKNNSLNGVCSFLDEGDSKVLNQVDLRLNENKLVDEDVRAIEVDKVDEDDDLHDSSKIVAFNFDGCLPKTSVKGMNADTWSLVSPSIPEKLHNRYKDELHDDREDTVNGLSIYSRMGVKTMGERDNKPFHVAIMRKFAKDVYIEYAIVESAEYFPLFANLKSETFISRTLPPFLLRESEKRLNLLQLREVEVKISYTLQWSSPTFNAGHAFKLIEEAKY